MPALFIPMMFGIPVLFCGVVGLNPHRRRNSVTAAATIMLFAVVAALARCGYGIALAEQFIDPPVGDFVVPDLDGENVDAYAANLAFATLVISSVFMVIFVFSLIRAKRERRLMSELKQEQSRIDVENAFHPAETISGEPISGVNQPHDPSARESVTVREFMSSPDP